MQFCYCRKGNSLRLNAVFFSFLDGTIKLSRKSADLLRGVMSGERFDEFLGFQIKKPWALQVHIKRQGKTSTIRKTLGFILI